MNVVTTIRTALSRALAEAGVDMAPADVPLEFPGELAHGDYASGVSLAKSKAAGTNPRALAEKLVASMGTIPGVSKIEIAGPGFINFTLSPETVAQSIAEARTSEKWGSGDARKGQKIMAEYTDPNPFKEFHIGHLMSNAIGESVARLLESTGAEVKRANYQGDVGPHVAKAIWGIRKLGVDPHDSALLGKAYAAGSAAYESDESAKADIDAINARVYDRADVAVNDIYDAGRAASLAHFEELYALLGTKFVYYFFESATAPIGLTLVTSHPKVFEESDGARVYKGEKKGLHTRVFITSRGLPTYETKDLGLLKLKSETWEADTYITVTASEQSDYFRVVRAAMEDVLPELAHKVQHITHGMMRFAEGKMSSRTGNVVTGESLIDELIEQAKVRAAESRADDKVTLAQQVAVAAIKYQVLRQGSGKDIVFDRERALSLEGDSGPYLQYAYARTNAILGKAAEASVVPMFDSAAPINDVARLVIRFPEVVARAASLTEPHLVTTYLQELASAFNSWYAQEQILDGTPAAAHKVALVDAVRSTLKNGLWVLGIPAPEKM